VRLRDWLLQWLGIRFGFGPANPWHNVFSPVKAAFAVVLMLGVVLAGFTLERASAVVLGGFEIDAEHVAISDALYSQSSDDWAAGAGAGGEPVFLGGTSGAPDFLGCYDSDISVNPSIDGAVTFLCDGSSDSSFDGAGPDVVVEPEQNIVTPGGKQIADIWNITAGSVTAKDDFSHAYSLFRFRDSPCDADTTADDPFLMLAGHRGDNEGDAFWGFELSQVPPTGFPELESNGGTTFDLDFNRTLGDLLISFTLVGGGTNPQLEVFEWDGATFVLSTGSCPTPPGPQGDSLLRTNPDNDIQAPPWNVPACDPTGTNASNTCRVVNRDGTAPASPGDNLIAPRDFNEAVIDLSAFVEPGVCFDSLIFTSRSAHPLENADLKDVGGVTTNLCALEPPSLPTPTPTPPPSTVTPTPTPTPLPPGSLPPAGGGSVEGSDSIWWVLVAGVALVLSSFVLIRRRSSS
jgi:hypothetical protein